MADFLSSVQYQPPPKDMRPEFTGHKVFQYASILKIESFEQKTALRFRNVHHGDWIFELARYDAFTGNTMTASSKTQWGATYWNIEWDNILGANSSLDVGESASWDPYLDKFFPRTPPTIRTGDHDGFQDFWKDMEYITRLIDEMKSFDK